MKQRMAPRTYTAGFKTLQPYVETTLATAVLIAICLFAVRGNWGLLDVNPHPLWIVAILIPLMYGIGPGLFAGAISAIGLTMLQARQVAPHTATDYSLVDPIVPVLMFAVATVVGEVRQRAWNRTATLLARNGELEAAVQDLGTLYAASEEAKESLQKRIAGQVRTFSTFYELARNLQTLDLESIPDAAADTAARATQGDSVSYWTVSGETLVLAGRYPAASPPQIDLQSLAGSTIFMQSRSARKTLSIRDILPTAAPMGLARSPQAAIVAPIVLGETVYAFLVVERLGFMQLTPSTVAAADTIAKWTAESIKKASLYSTTRDRNIEDEITGAFTSAYTMKRLVEEHGRATRFSYPLVVAVVEIEDYAGILPLRQPTVVRVLGNVFRHKLGPHDLLGRHPDGQAFLIMFPHRTCAEVGGTLASIADEIAAFGFQPYPDDRRLGITWRMMQLQSGSDPLSQIEATAALR